MSKSRNPDAYKSRHGRAGEYLVNDGREWVWCASPYTFATAIVAAPPSQPVVAMARVSSPVDANGSPVREDAS